MPNSHMYTPTPVWTITSTKISNTQILIGYKDQTPLFQVLPVYAYMPFIRDLIIALNPQPTLGAEILGVPTQGLNALGVELRKI